MNSQLAGSRLQVLKSVTESTDASDHSSTQPKESLFKKVSTTLVEPIFIELMSHLSHVKQMYCQPIHELKMSIQISRGMVDFDRVSSEKVLAGTEF